MAKETSPNPNNHPQPETADQVQSQERRLKYFEFVQAVALYAIVFTTELYSYGKEISGPLKPAVKIMEFMVKTVAGPVYNMIRPLLGKVLLLVDQKVDESVHKIVKHAPPCVKEALVDAQTTIFVVRSLVRTPPTIMAEETRPNPNNHPQPEMADQVQSQERRLKYFEFVQAVALYAIVFTAELYSYGKEISGPLKPAVKIVEFMVKTVVGPIYNMIRPLPGKALLLVDRKVDELVHKIVEHVPPYVKEALVDAQTTIFIIRSLVRTLSSGLGMAKSTYTTYKPTAKEMYAKYTVAQKYALSASQSLKSLVPLVPEVVRDVAPTASYLSEKYNESVKVGAQKGYKVASYLPLVPTAKIAELLSIPTPMKTN